MEGEVVTRGGEGRTTAGNLPTGLGGLGELPTEPGYKATLISLVVLRNAEGKFAATHEHDGWYLPAGRVDAGESFATGAVREALEEAGVPVKLTGIMRIEHTPGMGGSRLRVIYAAEQVDDTPLKTEPDDEVIEAKWITPEELTGLKLRSREVVQIFKWAGQGTRQFPDSDIINRISVQVYLVCSVAAVVADAKGRYLAVKGENGKWAIPSSVLGRPRQFKMEAAELIKQRADGALLDLKGVLKVYYFPPNSPHNKNKTGFMKVVFLASLAEKFKDVDLESKGDFLWMDVEKWSSLAQTEVENESVQQLVCLAHSTPPEQVAPVEIIAMELESLKVL